MMDQPQTSLPRSVLSGPSWKINLLVIGGLIFIILAHSLWQIGQLRKNFHHYAREHSKVVSAVIEQNTRTANLAENALQQTIKTFLANTARFIGYLDVVEPFSSAELTAFAEETGLSFIRIQPKSSCEGNSVVLAYLPGENLYVMNWPQDNESCIGLGFSAADIEQLHQQLQLPSLLKTLSAMPGIAYVTIAGEKNNAERPSHIFEQRITVADTILLVGLDTSRFTVRVRQIWRNVLFFTLALLCLGVFFSWLLYRYQKAYLQKITEYERHLAREREDATLGRATATITHELRNPLNAISMGLQRIELEAEELDPEHRQLTASMRSAVKRTNTIVGDLLRFSRPITTKKQQVQLTKLIDSILLLYKTECQDKKITVSFSQDTPLIIEGDEELLAQLFENLIKNGVEAQPGGGRLTVAIQTDTDIAAVSIENTTSESPSNLADLLEPYFTSKTRGTGLGLPIANRIAQAHGGTIELETPEERIFRVKITFPLLTT